MTVFPTLFVSHGAPDVAIAGTEASRFLQSLSSALPRPRAIVVASAHYEAEGQVRVSGDARPQTIHDFGGFDPKLHQLEYPAPGEPRLAAAIAERLRAASFEAAVETDRGFDHGTWVPLLLAYPDADIPVVQVSIDPGRDAAYHVSLGQALAPLREEGILVLGSGSFTHNLREAFVNVRSGTRSAATPDWVQSFADWMTDQILAGDQEALMDYRRRAPFAHENHPTDEHLMPLYVAMGAAGDTYSATRLHDSRDFGVLSMAAFSFA